MQQIHKWLVDVNVDDTKKAYAQGVEQCDCLECMYFAEAARTWPADVQAFFAQLGIDATQPSHLSVFSDGDELLYIGSYHVIGTLVEGEPSTLQSWNGSNTLQLQFLTLGFSQELSFVPAPFQKPVLQLNFEARIPR